MKTKNTVLLAFLSCLSFNVFAGQTAVDRQQLQTQIESREIQLERYKMERQMMFDLNELKTHMMNKPSERSKLEEKFLEIKTESLSRKALAESRNAE